MNTAPFKSNPVPWYCKVNLYQRMVENDAQEREVRVKAYAEQSYNMARLPPRMQEDEDRRKAEAKRPKSETRLNPDCTFRPPRAKPVPDFEALQTQFQRTLDAQRKSKSVTRPEPFNFSESRVPA
jgi:hypothetical protein